MPAMSDPYMDSLFAAGEVPATVKNSVRVQVYFDMLDKMLRAAVEAQEKGGASSKEVRARLRRATGAAARLTARPLPPCDAGRVRLLPEVLQLRGRRSEVRTQPQDC